MSVEQIERLKGGPKSGPVSEFAAELLRNHRQEYLLFYRKDAEKLYLKANGHSLHTTDWRSLYINLLNARGSNEMSRLADLLSVQFLDWCLEATEEGIAKQVAVPSFDDKYRLVNDKLRERLGEYIGKNCGSLLTEPVVEPIDWQHPEKYQEYAYADESAKKDEIARFSLGPTETVIACDYALLDGINNVNYYVMPAV